MKGLKLVLSACALLSVAGCGPAADRPARQPAEGGEIVFVSTLRDPPYAYFDEKTKEYAGIDVELVRAATFSTRR